MAGGFMTGADMRQEAKNLGIEVGGDLCYDIRNGLRGEET